MDNNIEAAATCEDDKEAKGFLDEFRASISRAVPPLDEIASRIANVNKVLATFTENHGGALVDLVDEAYGYVRTDTTKPLSKRNVRHAHIWPDQMVVDIIQGNA